MNQLPASRDTFIDNLPVQVVIQLDAVTIYQTSAFIAQLDKSEKNANEQQNCLQMMQVGESSYSELNLGLHVHDNAQHVLMNRISLLRAINKQLATESAALSSSAIKSLHWVNQVHGKQIHDIDASILSMQPLNADAMISQQAGVGLAIMTADCVPIVLYQPATGQIAAIHAGWQGLACGVIKATAERFDVDSPIIAWVGVCISQGHYEVGHEVAEKLLAGCITNQSLTATDLANFQLLFCIDGNSANKLNIDLPKLAVAQLNTIAITVLNESAIDCSYGCSRYYSYRRQTHLQQPATGRMALIIVRHDPIKI